MDALTSTRRGYNYEAMLIGAGRERWLDLNVNVQRSISIAGTVELRHSYVQWACSVSLVSSASATTHTDRVELVNESRK